MKKLICVILTLCLLFGLSVSVAAAQYANVMEMLTDWETNGYPADVGGIYSTDGSADHLTILLVGDVDHSREEELRAMLDDDSTVTFEAGIYSESELRVVKDEIADAFVGKADSGINSVGIGWGKDGGFGPSGMELRVVVTAEPDRVDEYAEMFYERYADAVVVEAGGKVDYSDEADLELATELPEEASQTPVIEDIESEEDVTTLLDAADAEAPAGETGEIPAEAPAEMNTGVWVIIFAALIAAAAVLVRLLRKNAKKGKKK